MKTSNKGQDDVDGAVRDYMSIKKDYVYDPDMFSTEPGKTARLKWIIEHKLNDVDRTLIILYTDCQSTRKLGRRLGISHSLVAREIRRIRENILREYEKIKDNEHLF